MTHVDEFVDDFLADDYARWVLLHMRLPAVLQQLSNKFLKDQLYCNWKGKRYRVTGASRLGDVWLHSNINRSFDPNQTTGKFYEHRVQIDECSDWGDRP